MPRMRTLKPEFWEDETVASLSRDARLLFMATWNAADDEGLLRWSAAYLKSCAFIYDDDLTIRRVEKLMAEIVTSELVFPYIGGKARQTLAVIVKFHRHQRPNRPQPSKLPAPSLQNPQVASMYAERDNWTCHICKGEILHGTESGADRTRWLSLDHVHPRSKGGSDYPSNIKAAHSGCNSGKKDSLPPAQPTPDLSTEPFSESVREPLTAVVGNGVGVGNGTGDVEGAGAVRRATTDLALVDPDRPTSQTIVGEWIDHAPKRPPQQVVGQVAKLTGQMLAEGIDADDVRRGIAAWMSKGLHPSSLPSVVNEVMNAAPTRGRATNKAQAWLTVDQQGHSA